MSSTTNIVNIHKFTGDDGDLSPYHLVAGQTITINIIDSTSSAVYYDVLMKANPYDIGSMDDVVVATKSTSKSFSATIPISFANSFDGRDNALLSFSFKGYSKDSSGEYWQESSGYVGYACDAPASFTPKITLAKAVIESGGLNGKLVAGYTKIKSLVTLSHNDSRDTIGFQNPTGSLYYTNLYSVNYEYSDGYLVSDYLLENSGDYSLEISANVKDNRGRSAYFSDTNTYKVCGYHLPTYDIDKTIISRCNAGGLVDGAGNYCKVKVIFSCSSVDGENSMQSVVASFNNRTLTPTSGSIAQGYLEYFIQIDSDTSGTIDLVFKDLVCTQGNEISLPIPKGTMPLSLFDDGDGTGVAIGQMATKHGFWVYENMIFHSLQSDGSSLPFVIKADPSGNIFCKQVIGGEFYEEQQKIVLNTTGTNWDSYDVVQVKKNHTDTEVVRLSGGGKTATLNILTGDFIKLYGLPMDYSSSDESCKAKVYLNGTEVTLQMNNYSYETDWMQINENTQIDVACGTFTPTDPRKSVSVSVSGAGNGYFIYDAHQVHTASNESLNYKVLSGTTIKLKASAVGKVFSHWMVGSTRYNTEELSLEITSSKTITCYFKDDAPTTYSSVSVSGYGGEYYTSLTITNSSGTKIYEGYARDSNFASQTLQVANGEELTLKLSEPNAFILEFIVNGETFSSYGEMNFSKTITISGDTTIVAHG